MPPRPVRRPAAARAAPRYRRSAHIVIWWRGRSLILAQYARGTRTVASPRIVAVLDAAATWRDRSVLEAVLPGVRVSTVRALVRSLVARGLLERSDMTPDPRDVGAAMWRGWQPDAGFFHQGTRDVPFWPRGEANAVLRAKARTSPPPPAVTSRPETPAHAAYLLPPIAVDGHLARTLRARRTWRRLGRDPLPLQTLAALVGLTWGVQAWIEVPGFGAMPLKTAPSGGARHAVEAYVAVRRVEGLVPGVYHYEAGSHRLVQLRRGLTRAALSACVPHQAWMGDAAAMIFMTAVIGRVQWRYPFARAYRTVLAECGHHAQTFCLLATERGLAPFCTMALADTVTEQLLGTDAWREPVLYAVGVGPRPAGTSWAPWPGTRRLPARRDRTPGRD